MSAVLSENVYFREYIREAEKVIKSAEVLTVRLKADKYYNHLIERNEAASDAAKKIYERVLFATLVMYRTLKETYPEQAYGIIERGAMRASRENGEKMLRLAKVPGAKTLFMTNLGHDVKKSYGPEAGFDTQFISSRGNYVQFDVKKCPVRQFCEDYGVPEIAKIFCMIESNEFSGIDGIDFDRVHSLELDGEKCNFRFEHVKEAKYFKKIS